MAKIAYIMRGVPGSGKSTIAARLAGDNGVIHSTDQYFMVDGVYVYDPTKLQECHTKNQTAFDASLQAGIPVVICDNTNVRLEHMRPYIEAANRHGYEVQIITVPHPDPAVAAARNTHGASLKTIERMIRRWED